MVGVRITTRNEVVAVVADKLDVKSHKSFRRAGVSAVSRSQVERHAKRFGQLYRNDRPFFGVRDVVHYYLTSVQIDN